MRIGILLVTLAGCWSTPRSEPVPASLASARKDIKMQRLTDVLGALDNEPLPGQVEGLLFAGGNQPWGRAFDHSGFLPRPQPDDEESPNDDRYWFVREAGPYALYFPSDGKHGVNFLAQWTVPLSDGTNGTYDAAMMTPHTPNPWGLRAVAHVVALDVNDRRGGTGLHFVATTARVLDQTYGIEPAAVLRELRRRFDAEVERREAELRAGLRRARHNRKELDGMPAVTSIAMRPTWSARERTLHVTFVLDMTRSGDFDARLQRPHMGSPSSSLVAHPNYDRPPPVHVSYGVAMAATYVADVHGKVLDELVYTPVAHDGELEQWTGPPLERIE